MSTIFHVIKDPVHGAMQFNTEENNWIKPFIDSENFQRLRQIKQLGLADLIFPGAVHNRFSHGIGSCYIASQICNKLGLSDEDKQKAILACLLHDIGHGPFSHAFEEIFYKQSITHEMWTPLFLQEYKNPEFLKRFNSRNKDFPLTSDKLDLIQELITHQFQGNKILADIVSSQLDADRLDYLLRDSHFCGVSYGGYDFRWLLHCLTVISEEGQTRLGITHKGIGAIEEYLMARRLMMRNVYQHGKKYGAEFLLKSFLQYLAQGLEQEERFTVLLDLPVAQFLQQMNYFNQQAQQGGNLEELTKRFIEENYYLYKQLCDYDIFVLIRELSHWDYDHDAVVIAERLYSRKLPKIIYINALHIELAKEMVEEFKRKHQNEIRSWQIAILMLPHLSYEMNHDPILVMDPRKVIKYLHDDSLMINAMSDKQEEFCIVSVDHEIADEGIVIELMKALQAL